MFQHVSPFSLPLFLKPPLKCLNASMVAQLKRCTSSSRASSTRRGVGYGINLGAGPPGLVTPRLGKSRNFPMFSTFWGETTGNLWCFLMFLGDSSQWCISVLGWNLRVFLSSGGSWLGGFHNSSGVLGSQPGASQRMGLDSSRWMYHFWI